MLMKGFTFGYGGRTGDYLKAETYESFDELCKVGINWIALAFDIRIAKSDSLEIRYDFNRDLSDYEIGKMVEIAHARGIKVCLKPMINSKDHTWRAHINFWDDEGAWAKWFYEYTGFMLHYARVAKQTGCEMLCLGCEMLGMEKHEEHWRALIEKVRAEYDGLLTYNTNHGHERDAKWYDAIDVIGTSGYFPVEAEPGADYATMLENWKPVVDELHDISAQWNKPIVFMEAGCRSARGCAMMPWDYMRRDFPADEDEQANFYASLVDAFAGEDWFYGVFWWDWSPKLPDVNRPGYASDFSIYGKKAFDELKKRYEAD
ncbi:MAG: glycosyl hydrolase family 53 [Lachnospiraceae bacterium]|nr:glycosyl hydrolase family 53 [Lachnospiraceae bacterium]